MEQYMIGQTVDQYKIIQSLGKSPVAEVFLAEHNLSRDRFVLYHVTPQLLALKGFKDALLDDASALMEWHHPRVLPVENILDQGGRLFLVQRFLEGPSLATLLRDRQNEPFPLAGYRSWLPDLLGSVEYLHEQGIVPRFLNPRKIVISPDGRGYLRVLGKVLPRYLETYRKKTQSCSRRSFLCARALSEPRHPGHSQQYL